VVCPYGAGRGPAGSGGGRVYISACGGGIIVVCWMAVSPHNPSTDILH